MWIGGEDSRGESVKNSVVGQDLSWLWAQPAGAAQALRAGDARVNAMSSRRVPPHTQR